MKQGRKYNRRVFSTVEVVGYDQNIKLPIMNEVISWDAKKDEFNAVGKSALLKKISDATGMGEKEIWTSIEQRAKVIKWLVNKNITDYRKVASVINMFYLSPDFLLSRIEGEV